MMGPMATTKKSTQAKTKTSSAKTTKPTAKRAVAKTTKKPTVTKAVKANTVELKSSPVSSLKNLSLFSVVISLVLAGVAGALMSTRSYEIVSGLQVKNELVSGAVAPFAPAVHHVYDLQIRYAVIAILVLSAIVPLVHLTLKKDRYAAALKTKVNPVRWIDTAIISALMLEIVAVLSGINEFMTIKLLAGFMLIAATLAWIAEKRNTQASRPVKSEMVVGIFASIMPWVIIGSYAIGTYAYGLVRSPWYVYALYAALIAGSAGYCWNLKRWVKGKTTNYEVAERNYLAIGIATKVAFAVILIVGLQK